MKEVKSVYLGVNGEAIKVWDRKDGILQKEYFTQVIQQLEERLAILEELVKITREEKENEVCTS